MIVNNDNSLEVQWIGRFRGSIGDENKRSDPYTLPFWKFLHPDVSAVRGICIDPDTWRLLLSRGPMASVRPQGPASGIRTVTNHARDGYIRTTKLSFLYIERHSIPGLTDKQGKECPLQWRILQIAYNDVPGIPYLP
jgi:hypothetical protein